MLSMYESLKQKEGAVNASAPFNNVTTAHIALVMVLLDDCV